MKFKIENDSKYFPRLSLREFVALCVIYKDFPKRKNGFKQVYNFLSMQMKHLPFDIFE